MFFGHEDIYLSEFTKCKTLEDLNGFSETGKTRELVRIEEAFHEKRFSQIADMICARGAKSVMLAGPSASGKTTSANRLAIQLRIHAKKPILISLDDYYIDRDMIAPGSDGKLDLEHINTIDTALFRQHIDMLLSGGTVKLPTFNFKTGKREYNGNVLVLSDDSIIIVEGLHALNPTLLPDSLNKDFVFKLYVTPMLPLDLVSNNQISANLLRLLRRILRDYKTRGASVQHTMAMWDSVCCGEKKWIFPYKEYADAIFNSYTLYELAALKKHIYPLLMMIQHEDVCYEHASILIKVLNGVLEADIEDEIPPTSIIREFIGGNSFYK